MTLKQPKQIITSIFNKYVKKQDNVVYAEKLFIINTIINYLFSQGDPKTTSKKLLEYGEIINRYLNNEVDIYWQDGTIMVKELKSANDRADGG